MISINELGKSHGAQILFNDFSLQLGMGNRYGIVGANGSGKSTILRILAGEEEASAGEINIPKKAKVGWLKQDQYKYDDERILDVVLMGNRELYEAMKEKEELLANAHVEFDGDRYSELEDIVMRHDGYSAESRAAEILEGLNILEDKHLEPMSVLSGGFKLRVLLAQVLAGDPDVLLLDEPTNHLDILSIRWLERFLTGYKGCALVVSHDRKFLNGVCTHMLDVDYQRVTLYRGNYDAFERLKVEERGRMEAEIEKRKDEIADHKKWIEKYKAKPTKARQANSKVKRMKKIVIDELPPSSRRFPKFKFKQRRATGKEVLAVRHVSKAYGDQQVLSDVSLSVERGDRAAIIGPNGIGKSTLLKIALGVIDADGGEVEWGYETHPGYFSQDHEDLRAGDNDTVLSWLWDHIRDSGPGLVRGKLAEVLFDQHDVEKKVKHLSGGESSRLVFSKLVVTEPNVLVLDEPTNHLDLEGIEALADGLKAYEGSMLFVSHNRWFVREVATRVIEIRPDGIEDYRGTYDEYLRYCGDDHLE